MVVCSVCGNKEKLNGNISFHRMPTDDERKRIWASLLGWSKKCLKKMHYICSNHFDASDIFTRANGRKYIKKDAFPILQHTVFENSSMSNLYYASESSISDHDEEVLLLSDTDSSATLTASENELEFFEPNTYSVLSGKSHTPTYTDSNILNKDVTNWCQATHRKHLLDGENQVPNRIKRKKYENEDSYSNPYVQPTLGVKVVKNTKPIWGQPKTYKLSNNFSSMMHNTAVQRQDVNISPNQLKTPISSSRFRPIAPNVRCLPHSDKSQTWFPIKHAWFEKTVIDVAKVNSNISFTLTQLHSEQSSASSVRRLSEVHNKLLKTLTCSVNSLIQIRQNLSTEFMAAIKTKCAPKCSRPPAPNSIKMIKSFTQLHPDNHYESTPNTGYLKVRNFSHLQNASSQLISIPGDNPPLQSNMNLLVVEMNEKENTNLSDDMKRNLGKKISFEIIDEHNKIAMRKRIEGDKDKSQREPKKNVKNNKKNRNIQNKKIYSQSNTQFHYNETNLNNSPKCYDNITNQVKTEHSYCIDVQSFPKLRRLLSVEDEMTKTAIVQNLVEQKLLEKDEEQTNNSTGTSGQYSEFVDFSEGIHTEEPFDFDCKNEKEQIESGTDVEGRK